MNSLAVHLRRPGDRGGLRNLHQLRRGEHVPGRVHRRRARPDRISVDALSRRAAQLLKVELIRPPRVIGKNTVESLQSGIIYRVCRPGGGIATHHGPEAFSRRPGRGDHDRHRRPRACWSWSGRQCRLPRPAWLHPDRCWRWSTKETPNQIGWRSRPLRRRSCPVLHTDHLTEVRHVLHQPIAQVNPHVGNVQEEEHLVAGFQVSLPCSAGVPQVW